MTTLRTRLVAIAAALALPAGLVVTTTVAAAPAEAASKVSSKPLKPKVKLQVKASRGAVLYSARTGKVVRDRKDRARRLARGSVRVYSHRVRYKKRDYRRISGTRYIVRLRDLRAVPAPRPAPKPAPRPTPKPPAPKPPVVTPPPVVEPDPDPEPQPPTPVPNPAVVRGPYNSQATTLVFGDSISDPTAYSTQQPGGPTAWWQTVADAAGTNVAVKAHGGSGMVNAGLIGCYWGRFGDWLGEIDRVKPQFIVVEGGRNDPQICDPGASGSRPATEAEQRNGIFEYAAALRAAADRNGIPPTRVYMWNAWGSGSREYRPTIVAAMKDAAAAYGFTFVDVPPMEAGHVHDGTHPNPDGGRWLATQFLQRSDYAQRLAAWKPAVVPAA